MNKFLLNRNAILLGLLLVNASLFDLAAGFLLPSPRRSGIPRRRHVDPGQTRRSSSSSKEETGTVTDASFGDTNVSVQENKFKVLTCMSTACCQKRKALSLDSLATFGAMYARASASSIQVEESPCLGSCKLAPCIGVEHEDYVGCVALEGMTDEEFGAKAFHNIITEGDADRVWSCIENAVQLMVSAAEEEEDQQ